MGGISIWQLLIILVIVLVVFGAKRLRNIGSDLGASVKGFRDAMREGEQEEDKKTEPSRITGSRPEGEEGHVFEGETTKERDRV